MEIIDKVYPGSVLHFILLLRECSAILWLSGDLFCNFTKKAEHVFVDKKLFSEIHKEIWFLNRAW